MPIVFQPRSDDLGVSIRNTSSMDMQPTSPSPYEMLDPASSGRSDFSLLLTFSGDVFLSLVPYPILVESWERRKYGRLKRSYEATFSSRERNKIARYYGRFYRWYLVSGTPKTVSLKCPTLLLLQRAAAWFASC